MLLHVFHFSAVGTAPYSILFQFLYVLTTTTYFVQFQTLPHSDSIKIRLVLYGKSSWFGTTLILGTLTDYVCGSSSTETSLWLPFCTGISKTCVDESRAYREPLVDYTMYIDSKMYTKVNFQKLARCVTSMQFLVLQINCCCLFS